MAKRYPTWLELACAGSTVWPGLKISTEFIGPGSESLASRFIVEFFSRLIAVGEEFCGSKSEDLHDSIRTQTVNYFKNYHRSVRGCITVQAAFVLIVFMVV